MLEPLDHEAAMAVGDFLHTHLRDLEAGQVRPLADYQALYPGHEDTIEREFTTLTHPETGDPDLPRTFGPYLLQEIIGQGGQAIVYRAEDTRLGRRVALKLLDVVGRDADEAVVRLGREAALASRLDHPAICTVFETGVQDRRPFIAMRWVEGESLSTRVARWKRERQKARESDSETSSPRQAVLRQFASVARALHATHEAGILHQDVKPANIMIGQDEEPVIVDFGVARLRDGDLPTLTRPGQILGTPSYMAPERFDETVPSSSPSVDIWGLGVCLFEALTLKRPFEAPTGERLINAIQTRQPPNPRALAPGIGRDLSVVLETLLQKDPARRYQTCAIVADELDAVLDGRPICARRPALVGRVTRWSRRHPAAAAAMIAICVACGALSGWYGYFTTTRDDLDTIAEQRLRAEVEGHLEDAFVPMMTLDLAGARPHLEQALSLDPECGEAIGGLALLLAHQGDPEGAVLLLGDAPMVVKRHPALMAIRAACRSARAGAPGPLPEPAAMLDAESHFLMAVGHSLTRRSRQRLSNGADSYAHARRAVLRNASHPRPLYDFVACTTASNARRHKEALEIAHSAVHLWPDSALARYTLFHALICDPRSDRADLERARQLRESVGERFLAQRLQFDVAVLHMRMGELGDAERVLRASFARRDPGGQMHQMLVTCLRRAGRREEAIREGRTAMARYPGNEPLAVQVAFSLMELGQGDEAERVCRDLLNRRSCSVEVTFSLAKILIEQGNPEEALALVERGLRLDSKPAGRYVKARALQRLERHVEAEVELRITLETHPNPFGYISHALSLAHLGRVPEAVKQFDWVATASADDPKVLFRCASVYLLAAERTAELDVARAVGWVREAIGIDGRTPNMLRLLAKAHFSDGDVREAITVQEELVSTLEEGKATSEKELWRAKRRLRQYRRDL